MSKLNIIALGDEMFANHARSLIMGLAKKPVMREAGYQSDRAVDEQPAQNLIVVSTTYRAAETYVLNVLHASKLPSNIDCVGVQEDYRLRGKTRNGFMLFLPDLQLVAGHHWQGVIQNYELAAQGTRCPNNLHLVMPEELQTQFLIAHFDHWVHTRVMDVNGYGPSLNYGSDDCVIGMKEANFLLDNTFVKIAGDDRQAVRFSDELERLNGEYLTRLFNILHHPGRPLVVPLEVAKIMYSYDFTHRIECPIELQSSKPVDARATRVVCTGNITFYANNPDGLNAVPGNPTSMPKPTGKKPTPARKPAAAKKPATPRARKPSTK